MDATPIDPPESDEHLILHVGRGDRLAFGRLLARHRGRIAAVAARITGNRAAADDIVQETFLRAWVKAPAWVPATDGGAARVTTWLARVATNLALDRARRFDPPSNLTADPADPGPDAEAALLAREQDRLLRLAVAGLPPRQRAAIALTYDQGLANADGARALEITVGALELLLVRARRTLREKMKTLMEPVDDTGSLL